MKPCPCNHETTYESCCKPFHDKKKRPDQPLKLMKSRYSAYALGLTDYIIETTHPDNPQYLDDKNQWADQINQFCMTTQFLRLEIVDHSVTGKMGFVTFRAYLKQGGADASFQERSRFILDKGNWLYLDGKTRSMAN